jgi:hypothetical protein
MSSQTLWIIGKTAKDIAKLLPKTLPKPARPGGEGFKIPWIGSGTEEETLEERERRFRERRKTEKKEDSKRVLKLSDAMDAVYEGMEPKNVLRIVALNVIGITERQTVPDSVREKMIEKLLSQSHPRKREEVSIYRRL